MDISSLRRTFLTNPFKDIINAVQSKSFRQINHRDMGAFHKDCRTKDWELSPWSDLSDQVILSMHWNMVRYRTARN